MIFLRLLFLLILPWSVLTSTQYPLSICSIFKNEAEYLKEWIEFHKLQGVQHFFLYNNNSTDHYLEVLKPYLESNEVSLIDWPERYEEGNAKKWLKIQCDAYMHCIRQFGALTDWLAAIDIDEFLFCPNGEQLTDFLKRFDPCVGVCAHWLLFGTSEVEEIPKDKLLIETLVRCSPKNLQRNQNVKSIVRPKFVIGCISPHFFKFCAGYTAVDAYGNSVHAVNSPFISHDRIRINHYWTRSENYFREHKIASRHRRRTSEDEKKLMEMANRYNECEDRDILQFVPNLRSKIFD